MKFLRDDVLEELVSFLKKYKNIESVVLFGSRARGDFSRLSDYDIAINGVLSDREISEIRNFINWEINTLKKIDLIFLQDKNLPLNLTLNIQKDGINIW